MQTNETTNYIFGTLRRQDTALRGIIRDLKAVKNTSKANKNLVIGCSLSLALLGFKVSYLSSRIDILEKEMNSIKSRMFMLTCEKSEEAN